MSEDFYEETTYVKVARKDDGGQGQSSPDAKWIKDKETAHELANIEKSFGRDKALAREQELKRQHETGLSDSERENIAFIEGLLKMYPHSFTRDVGSDGKVYFEMKRTGEEQKRLEELMAIKTSPDKDRYATFTFPLERVIFSQDGVLEVHFNQMDSYKLKKPGSSDESVLDVNKNELKVTDPYVTFGSISPSDLFQIVKQAADTGGIDLRQKHGTKNRVLHEALGEDSRMEIKLPGDTYSHYYRARVVDFVDFSDEKFDPEGLRTHAIRKLDDRLERVEIDNARTSR